MTPITTLFDMPNPTTAALPLLAITLLAAEAPPKFIPAAGEEVERTTVWKETSSTEDFTALLDGQESSEVPSVFSEVTRTFEVVTRDVLARSTTNEQQALVRHYDELTLEMSTDVNLVTGMGDAELSFEGEGSSELEGLGVRFERGDDGWKKSWAEDYDGRQELLDGLNADAEFIALLPDPEEDVAVGDEWDIDLDLLHELLRPGGSIPLEIETDLQAIQGLMDPMKLPGAFDLLDGERDGEIVAQLGKSEDDQRVITFKVDVTVTSEQTDAVTVALDNAIPDGVEGAIDGADFVLTIEGSGKLFWDEAAQRMSSLEFTAETSFEIEVGVEVLAEGMQMDAVLREKRAGTIELTIE